jgi:hypothetical protein
MTLIAGNEQNLRSNICMSSLVEFKIMLKMEDDHNRFNSAHADGGPRSRVWNLTVDISSASAKKQAKPS